MKFDLSRVKSSRPAIRHHMRQEALSRDPTEVISIDVSWLSLLLLRMVSKHQQL